MAVDDIVFCEGEINNFIVEMPNATANSPVDILIDNSNNVGLLCLETPIITSGTTTAPETVILSDGHLAKRVNDNFYLRL